MCFSVCGPGDGGENPAFRNIPVRWRENLSGRSWTAWDHKDTQTERVKEPRSPALNTKTHREKNPVHLLLLGGNTIKDMVEDRDIQWCYRLRNLARSRPILHNQTPGGVSVTHAHTHQRWRATLVLLGCLLLSMLLLGLTLGMTSKTNRSGDVISEPGRSSSEQAVHIHSHTLILWKACISKKHSHIQILTSRSVNAKCC